MNVAKNTNNIEALLDNAVKSLVTLEQLYKDGDVKNIMVPEKRSGI